MQSTKSIKNLINRKNLQNLAENVLCFCNYCVQQQFAIHKHNQHNIHTTNKYELTNKKQQQKNDLKQRFKRYVLDQIIPKIDTVTFSH